jgi:hypothetical protein
MMKPNQSVPKSAQVYVIATDRPDISPFKSDDKMFYKKLDDKWQVWYPDQAHWGECSNVFKLDEDRLNIISKDGVLYWLDPTPEEMDLEDPYLNAEGYVKSNSSWGERLFIKENIHGKIMVWKPKGVSGGTTSEDNCWVEASCKDIKGFISAHSIDKKLYALARNQIEDKLDPQENDGGDIADLAVQQYLQRKLQADMVNELTNCEMRSYQIENYASIMEALLKLEPENEWLNEIENYHPKPEESEIEENEPAPEPEETASLALQREVSKEMPAAARVVAGKKAKTDINQVALATGMLVQHVFSKKQYVLLYPNDAEDQWFTEDADGTKEWMRPAVLRVCDEITINQSDLVGWVSFLLGAALTFVTLAVMWHIMAPIG